MHLRALSCVVFACGFAASVSASTFTIRPTYTLGGDSNVHDPGILDRMSASTRGIAGVTSGSASHAALKSEPASGRYAISGATPTIARISNWDARDTNNNLFIHLPDNPKTGVQRLTDDPTDNGINQGGLSDYFAGKIAGNRVIGKWMAYGSANTSAGALLATGATNLLVTQYHDADGPATKPSLVFAFSGHSFGPPDARAVPREGPHRAALAARISALGSNWTAISATTA